MGREYGQQSSVDSALLWKQSPAQRGAKHEVKVTVGGGWEDSKEDTLSCVKQCAKCKSRDKGRLNKPKYNQ